MASKHQSGERDDIICFINTFAPCAVWRSSARARVRHIHQTGEHTRALCVTASPRACCCGGCGWVVGGSGGGGGSDTCISITFAISASTAQDFARDTCRTLYSTRSHVTRHGCHQHSVRARVRGAQRAANIAPPALTDVSVYAMHDDARWAETNLWPCPFAPFVRPVCGKIFAVRGEQKPLFYRPPTPSRTTARLRRLDWILHRLIGRRAPARLN